MEAEMKRLAVGLIVLALSACAAAGTKDERSALDVILYGSGQGGGPSATRQPASTPAPIPEAPQCQYRSEVVSGFNKICYYDCLGSARAVTVASTDLCNLAL